MRSSARLRAFFVGFFLLASSRSPANIDQHLVSLDFAIDHAILVRAISKETCSCVFVEKQSLERCWTKLGLPSAVKKLVRLEIIDQQGVAGVRVSLTSSARTVLAGAEAQLFAESHYATDNPRRGCRLQLGGSAR